jgi:hypothetical protein
MKRPVVKGMIPWLLCGWLARYCAALRGPNNFTFSVTILVRMMCGLLWANPT